MSEIFNDKTTAEIDAKLHRDILKHNLNIEKISIGLVILLMILSQIFLSSFFDLIVPFIVETGETIFLDIPELKYPI